MKSTIAKTRESRCIDVKNVHDIDVSHLAWLLLLSRYSSGGLDPIFDQGVIPSLSYLCDSCARMYRFQYKRVGGEIGLEGESRKKLDEFIDAYPGLADGYHDGIIKKNDINLIRGVLSEQCGHYTAYGIEVCMKLLDGYESYPMGIGLLTGVFWYGGNGYSLLAEGIYSKRQVAEALKHVSKFCDWLKAWSPETTWLDI